MQKIDGAADLFVRRDDRLILADVMPNGRRINFDQPLDPGQQRARRS